MFKPRIVLSLCGDPSSNHLPPQQKFGYTSGSRLRRGKRGAETRLREIERHREAISGVLRQSIEEIEGADFRDVETWQVTIDAGPRPARVSRAPIAPAGDRAQWPRTATEKARAAQNAVRLRHGFNVPVLSVPSLARRSRRWRAKSLAPTPMPKRLEWARRILASASPVCALVVRIKRLRPSTFGQAIEMTHAVKDSSV
jgi:hypothetical protein